MLLSKLFSSFFLRRMQEQPEPFSNTRIVCIVSCSKTKEKRPNYDKYSQTGITVKINTNHDGVRATAIMLRSIAPGLSGVAISGHRDEASLRNYISRPSSKQLRAYSDTLPVRRVEGHISLSSTAQSPRAIYMFLWIRPSFIYKTPPWAVCFLIAMRKKPRVFMSFNSSGFQGVFYF